MLLPILVKACYRKTPIQVINKARVFSMQTKLHSQDFSLWNIKNNEYYNEISQRIRTRFPQEFGDDKPRPTQKVASAIRTSSTGRRTVKLTPSQVAIAKKLGVPLEEYAKHVKEA